MHWINGDAWSKISVCYAALDTDALNAGSLPRSWTGMEKLSSIDISNNLLKGALSTEPRCMSVHFYACCAFFAISRSGSGLKAQLLSYFCRSFATGIFKMERLAGIQSWSQSAYRYIFEPERSLSMSAAASVEGVANVCLHLSQILLTCPIKFWHTCLVYLKTRKNLVKHWSHSSVIFHAAQQSQNASTLLKCCCRTHTTKLECAVPVGH